MKRYLSLPVLSLAAVITLAGCGTDSGTTPAPASSATAGTSGSPAATDAQPDTAVSMEHNDADVMFAQMMIPHHQQAVAMSDILLEKESISPEVTDLATRIKDAQGPEIETMTSWLEAWDESVEPDGGMESHSMGSMEGMMSDDQMAEFEAAEGDEASRMFLESMTAHHEGAVSMAQDEIDNGQNPEARELAETIVETQQAEIQEMETLLANL
ncbi:DUF305 domain-containing protein [Arthrobacter sp. H41]|uniref:DUF305 domain-containing protein n=1 Tax=Arthrobacter sp. H41 TaxID=1312978 RepID=UPI00047D4617|nr:DUF305 domain-containing protein [Arthrobacter sp. H41]